MCTFSALCNRGLSMFGVWTTSKTEWNKYPITATGENSSLSHCFSEGIFIQSRLWCSSKLLHRLQLWTDSNFKGMRDGVSFCGHRNHRQGRRWAGQENTDTRITLMWQFSTDFFKEKQRVWNRKNLKCSPFISCVSPEVEGGQSWWPGGSRHSGSTWASPWPKGTLETSEWFASKKIYQTIQTDLQSYTYNNKLMKAE